MSSPRCCVWITLLAIVSLTPSPAFAAWPSDPHVNLPVCTASGDQMSPGIVGDGSGGVIIVWADDRSTHNIYAQHVLASGDVDPSWPVGGRALCSDSRSRWDPVMVPDGAGGAIIAWNQNADATGPDEGVHAQHLLANGAIDPAWPVDGRVLCTVISPQVASTIVADGAGGAIVVWEDYRGGSEADLYAQHVRAGGTVDPAWPSAGLALCVSPGYQWQPRAVSDGAGGAIVVWGDSRGGTITNVYAQHVLASGAVDTSWPTNGSALCTAPGGQSLSYTYTIVSDGTGGAVVTWEDYRKAEDIDVYAQRVLQSGAIAPGWPTDGRALCTLGENQYAPRLATDGAGGAIVCWRDFRNGVDDDTYVQHVLAGGALDPAWPSQGRALCTAINDQWNRAIISDGAGGAVVAWRDFRTGYADDDIYAHHVLANGLADPAWPADGRGLSTAQDGQAWPEMVPDGGGGAIVAWEDHRSGVDYDIYAQRVAGNGQLGEAVVDVPREPRSAFALDAVRPNPVRGVTPTAYFTLPGPGAATLELLDVTGRCVLAREVGSLGAGSHQFELSTGRRLAPGIYLLRLRGAGNTRVRRLAVLE